MEEAIFLADYKAFYHYIIALGENHPTTSADLGEARGMSDFYCLKTTPFLLLPSEPEPRQPARQFTLTNLYIVTGNK
ncbi:hypothetical protein SFRURICE_010656 [Spodoptera frugiperda]|nr:hypothetical protein SFRURICE_010656 [Spodoptera frugiperda]